MNEAENKVQNKVNYETGWYEATVGKITSFVKPYLHQKTDNFVKKSIDEKASDNLRLAKMIEFEVKRRGDGAGLTQDVAEPLLWIGIKTLAAVATAVVTDSLKEGKFKLVGRITALGILLNNGVELFRLVPRYVAGLQGSLQMALDRWKSIEDTGVDPFDHGGRLIHKVKDEVAKVPDWNDYITPEKIAKFAESEMARSNNREIQPKTLAEHAEHNEAVFER